MWRFATLKIKKENTMVKKVEKSSIQHTKKFAFASTAFLFCLLMLSLSPNSQNLMASASLNVPPKLNDATETTISNSSTNFGSTLPSYPINTPLIPESYGQQKSLSLLSDVFGFNLTSYIKMLISDKNESYLGSSQENVVYTLVSNQGSFRVISSIIGNHLHQIYICDSPRTISLNRQVSNGLEMTRTILQSYQRTTGNSFYGSLYDILNGLTPNQNITKSLNNINLQVTTSDQGTTSFTWTYVDTNGVSAPIKNVYISYDNGVLHSFVDNWQLYNIAEAPKISAQDATAIALSAAQNYSYTVSSDNGTVTSSISNMKIVGIGDLGLSYLNYQNVTDSRSNDPFTLYPCYCIPVHFDKVYPGGVTEVTVRVWADSGIVNNIAPTIWGETPTTESSQTSADTFIGQGNSAFIIAIAGLAMILAPYAAFRKFKRFTVK